MKIDDVRAPRVTDVLADDSAVVRCAVKVTHDGLTYNPYGSNPQLRLRLNGHRSFDSMDITAKQFGEYVELSVDVAPLAWEFGDPFEVVIHDVEDGELVDAVDITDTVKVLDPDTDEDQLREAVASLLMNE